MPRSPLPYDGVLHRKSRASMAFLMQFITAATAPSARSSASAQPSVAARPPARSTGKGKSSASSGACMYVCVCMRVYVYVSFYLSLNPNTNWLLPGFSDNHVLTEDVNAATVCWYTTAMSTQSTSGTLVQYTTNSTHLMTDSKVAPPPSLYQTSGRSSG